MNVFLKYKLNLLLFKYFEFLEWYIIKFQIQWKKFGLIWSCILKDMIFTIFRDFSAFFRIFYDFLFYLKH